MKQFAFLFLTFVLLPTVQAQDIRRDIPYADPAHERQVLDVYSPRGAKNLPVVFWIHGGGWQAGDKTAVQLKPQIFVEKGFVFVSTNYRLLPNVDMETIIRDVAKSLGWVHKHIADHPDNAAQAQRLGAVLKEAELPVTVFGAKETNHTKINENLGLADDPSTKALFEFVEGK